MHFDVAGNQKSIDVISLYSACYILAGLGTLGMVWWCEAVGMCVCATVVGFCTAAYGPVLTEVTCILLGVHRLV